MKPIFDHCKTKPFTPAVERERESEREREMLGERERETDRQTDRQTPCQYSPRDVGCPPKSAVFAAHSSSARGRRVKWRSRSQKRVVRLSDLPFRSPFRMADPSVHVLCPLPQLEHSSCAGSRSDLTPPSCCCC